MRPPQQFALSSKLHEHVVLEILNTSREHGIGVLFIVLPTKYQIEPESQQKIFSALEDILELDPKHKIDDEVRQDFIAILNRHNVDYLDPYDEFIEAKSNSTKELYWNQDHHLSEFGHNLLGKMLVSKLKEMATR